MKIVYMDKGISIHTTKLLDYWAKTFYLKKNKQNKKILINNFILVSFHNGKIWPDYPNINLPTTKYNFYRNINILNMSDKYGRESGFNIFHKPTLRPRYSHFFLIYFTKMILKKLNPDIIHSVYLTTNGYYAAKSNFHPLIQQVMGSDILLQSKQWPYSIWVRKALKEADMVLVDAKHEKNIIRKLGYNKLDIKINPVGLDIQRYNENNTNSIREKFNWSKEENYKIIIYNRWHEEIYGWKYLLKGFSKVIEKIPKARLIAIGSGSKTNSYLKLAKTLGISKYIKWVGAVQDNEMPYYLNASDLYVNASLSDGPSVSMREAMACKKPVVVTDNPCVLEWVTHRENGLVVPRRNPKALADAIIELLKDENMAKRFGKKNREITEKRGSLKRYMTNIKKYYIEIFENYHKRKKDI